MTDSTGSTDVGNPGANASGTEGATTTTTTADTPWYGTIEDGEIRGFAELKGWKTPADAIVGYRNLEKFTGVPPERLLKLPENGDDAGWGEVHKRLGFSAPEKAEDYGLSGIEGFDKDFIPVAEKALLSHKVPKDMATGVMKDVAAALVDLETQFNQQRQHTFDQDLTKLRGEWGGNFDALTQLGQRAAAEFAPKAGLEPQDLEAIRDAVGQAKFSKFFAGIGSTTGESAFVEGTGATPAVMTPDAARARISQLGEDREWFKRFEAGDARAVNEYQRLRDIVANAAVPR